MVLLVLLLTNLIHWIHLAVSTALASTTIFGPFVGENVSKFGRHFGQDLKKLSPRKILRSSLSKFFGNDVAWNGFRESDPRVISHYGRFKCLLRRRSCGFGSHWIDILRDWRCNSSLRDSSGNICLNGVTASCSGGCWAGTRGIVWTSVARASWCNLKLFIDLSGKSFNVFSLSLERPIPRGPLCLIKSYNNPGILLCFKDSNEDFTHSSPYCQAAGDSNLGTP